MYPLCNICEICIICSLFQDALVVNVCVNLLKGLWSYEGFKLRGRVFPKFSVPLSGKTVHWTPKSFRAARTCSRSSITISSLGGSDFATRAARNIEFLLAALHAVQSASI